jgi:gliding motility-associated-like protein
MNGCRDTVKMTVENINAGANQTICLNQAAFILPVGVPVGGYWKGKGISDTATGLYDPALFGKVANDTLTYFSNGCSAKKVMFVRTVIVAKKTLGLCIEQAPLILNNASVQNSPAGGTWTGTGITGSTFTASVAGYGTHKLIYNFNGCTDSTFFTIYPKSNIQKDTTFCQTDPQFILYNGQAGGYFKGKGIIDTAKGIFRPLTAGVGVHLINYFSINGCKDSLRITVTALPIVNLSGLNPFYCLKDTFDGLTGLPAGGTFWGKGVSGNTFNPKDAGSGTHKAYYQFGTPTCYRVDSVPTLVGDTLRVRGFSDRDTICLGENIQLSATGSGGQVFDYTFLWSDGQRNKIVFQSPAASGNYWVTISDGCSDAATDSVFILVNPKVSAQIQTSPITCYGQKGFAEVIPGTADVYQVTWRTAPPVNNFRINAPVANKYYVDILNVTTGCRLDTFAVIPGYGKIKAYFMTVPAEGICMSPFDPTVYIINQSIGADTGTWYFGDGSKTRYNQLINPSHTYAADTTRYRIKLVISNIGGCMDSMEVDVCLSDSVYVIVPTAFTPDGNNRNEVFKPVVAGAREYEFMVYNRWGEKVFYTNNTDEGWDGSYLGKPCQNGVYLYLVSFQGRKTVTKLESGTVLLLR